MEVATILTEIITEGVRIVEMRHRDYDIDIGSSSNADEDRINFTNQSRFEIGHSSQRKG